LVISFSQSKNKKNRLTGITCAQTVFIKSIYPRAHKLHRKSPNKIGTLNVQHQRFDIKIKAECRRGRLTTVNGHQFN
jgi:hypothetical protein